MIMLKRFFDIVTAVVGLILCLPIMFVLSIAIVLESGWPFIFSQTRVGQNCQKFAIYKFRSMFHRVDISSGDCSSEHLDKESLQAQRAAYQTTAQNDVRITRVGSFIRKSHLDE